jgi:hypothetical protein
MNIVANRLFDTSLSQRWSFSSKSAMRKQLERIRNRIHNPRRALASVPWSRCFPPYLRAQREISFLIGSLRVYRKGEYSLSHTLVISASFGGHPILCQGRGDHTESQFTLPVDFFDRVLVVLVENRKSLEE